MAAVDLPTCILLQEATHLSSLTRQLFRGTICSMMHTVIDTFWTMDFCYD
jgi:hypothetical protein